MRRFRSPASEARYRAMYAAHRERWPVPWKEQRVDTSFGRTLVRISGPADAPPLLLLPGVGSSSLMWLPCIGELSERHRTYAIDNIADHGLSEPTTAVTNEADYVRWLDELAAGLGLDRFALMGISYGGWVSVRYALARPSRLSRLVLLAPAGAILPLTFGFLWRAILCLIPLRFFTKRLMVWLAADALADPASRGFVERAIEEGWTAIRAFRASQVVPPLPLSDDAWGRLAVPTLVVIGEHEKIFDPRAARERLARVAPQVTQARVLGAGHDLLLVPSTRTVATALQFIEEDRP